MVGRGGRGGWRLAGAVPELGGQGAEGVFQGEWWSWERLWRGQARLFGDASGRVGEAASMGRMQDCVWPLGDYWEDSAGRGDLLEVRGGG